MCDEVVHATNWPNLFLSKNTRKADFLRPLHPEEVSVRTNAAITTDFAYEQSYLDIENAFAALLRQDCQARDHASAHDYGIRAAAQKATTDGETASLSPVSGTFVTASGDAWYRYQCRPIIAVGVQTATCYNALPIQLTPADLQRYAGAKNISVASITNLFLEPHTHVLSNVAITTPCTSLFTPLYRNTRGDWIKWGGAGADLEIISPPTETAFVVDKDRKNLINHRSFDSYADGLYSGAALDDAEQWRQQGLVRDAYSYKMAAQTTANVMQHGAYKASDSYGELPDGQDYYSIMKGIWNIARLLGDWGATLFAILVLWLALTSLVGAVHRVYLDYKESGFGLHLLGAIFPANFFRRLVGIAREDHQHGYACQFATREELEAFIRAAIAAGPHHALAINVELELAAGAAAARAAAAASAPPAEAVVNPFNDPQPFLPK